MGAPGSAVLCGSRIAASDRVWEQDEGIDVTGWTKTNDFILAVGVETEAAKKCASTIQIQWRDATDVGSFAALAATGEMKFGATNLVDGNAVTSGEAGTTPSGAQTWQDGEEIEGANDGIFSTGSTADNWSEYQYSISPADANDEHEYEFRLWDVTDGVSAGTLAVTITTAAGAAETYTPESDDDVELSEYTDLRIPKLSEISDDDATVEDVADVKARLGSLALDDDATVSEDVTIKAKLGDVASDDDLGISEFQSLRIPKSFISVDDNLGISEYINISIPEDIFYSVSIDDDINLSEDVSIKAKLGFLNLDDDLGIIEFQKMNVNMHINVP